MGKARVANTFHGNDRAVERTGLYKCQREKLIKDASRYGKKWQNLEPGPLQTYLRYKGERKRVKYFCGYVFVFQKNSTSLITMYPVPPKVLKNEKLCKEAREAALLAETTTEET